jgi:cobalt-zinc-cadmium efflux system outer membrane protein
MTRFRLFTTFLFVGCTLASAQAAEIDLASAIHRALRDNPELKSKRHSLGIAQGRVQQAGLLLQNNPRFGVELESATSRNAGTSVELNLQQELEIAGQRGHRIEAAEKHLLQAQWAIEDAERLLRLEVTTAFYHLLAVQQNIADAANLLVAQDSLLQAAEKRFARQDITILELNTLRLDRDQARSELANKSRERLALEHELRRLVASDKPLAPTGNLLEIVGQLRGVVPDRQKTLVCSLANRADLKAAKLVVETREAETRLAQARRIPNISIGPRFRRDGNQNIVGGAIEVPLPFFNRNQEEIATALANQNISRAELEGRALAVKQQLESTYARLALTKEKTEAYGGSYLTELDKMLALAHKAYESDVMSIFEFSVTRDRFAQARARANDAALAYLLALAELEAQAPGCLP